MTISFWSLHITEQSSSAYRFFAKKASRQSLIEYTIPIDRGPHSQCLQPPVPSINVVVGLVPWTWSQCVPCLAQNGLAYEMISSLPKTLLKATHIAHMAQIQVSREHGLTVFKQLTREGGIELRVWNIFQFSDRQRSPNLVPRPLGL